MRIIRILHLNTVAGYIEYKKLLPLEKVNQSRAEVNTSLLAGQAESLPDVLLWDQNLCCATRILPVAPNGWFPFADRSKSRQLPFIDDT